MSENRPGWAVRVAALSGWRRWLTLIGLGALASAALPPFGVVFALVPAFTGLLWLSRSAAWRRAFGAGWAFGVGHFATGLYWVAHAFFVDGALYAWLAPVAVVGLAAGMALFPALAVAAANEFSRILRLGLLGRVLALAGFWSLAEWLRGEVLTGFPWNLIGSAWVASDAVLQGAAWVGVFGLGLISVIAAALPAVLLDGASRRNVAFAASGIAGFALLWGLGAMRLQAAASNATDAQGEKGEKIDGVRLRLVQPNIAQHLKWRADLRLGHVQRQIAMSRQPAEGGVAPTHVIWPETAVPFNLANDRPLQKVLGRAAPPGGLLITGAPRAAGASPAERQLWNSAHALTPAGVIVATYDKRHLVPFGEYVPFRHWLKFSKLTEGRLDFSPGTGPRILDLPGLPAAGLLICYEIIFPDAMPRASGAGRRRPGWLLNITNDAWFGDSAGPHQHLAAAQLRAVEQGLAVVRVANTGISAVIDPYGRVRASLPLGRAGVIDSNLPAALAETPFARFGRTVTWAIILAALVAAGVLGRRRPGLRT